MTELAVARASHSWQPYKTRLQRRRRLGCRQWRRRRMGCLQRQRMSKNVDGPARAAAELSLSVDGK